MDMEELFLKELIVWDFDGTIVDLDVDWGAIKQDLQQLILQKNIETNEHRLGAMLSVLSEKGYKEEAFAIIKKYEHNAPYTKIEPAINIIKKLQKDQAIFSDNLKITITTVLDELQMQSCFKTIIAKDDVTKFKPSAEGLKKILKLYEVPKDKVVYIGDKMHDQHIAEECDVDFMDIKVIQ